MFDKIITSKITVKILFKKIEEYPLLPKAIKDVLKENKFPIHKINNDLK